jgi:hypothetical protein
MLLGTSSSCFLKAKWRIFAAQKRADLMKKNKKTQEEDRWSKQQEKKEEEEQIKTRL